MQVSCNKGHTLQWSNNRDYIAGKFKCNRCGGKGNCTDGRFHCPKCKFDACSKCCQVSVSVSPSNSPYSFPGVPAQPLCPQGDKLQWSSTTNGYSSGRYICNSCRKSKECSLYRWHCPNCQHDICPDCKPGPSPQQISYQPEQMPSYQMPGGTMPRGPVPIQTLPMQLRPGQVFGGKVIPDQPGIPHSAWQPAPSVPRCKNFHPLKWSDKSYTGGVYVCDNCKSSFSCSGGRWSCDECSYDLCPNCKESGMTGVSYPGMSPPAPFIATDPSQAGGPATPTVCMGGHDPNGIGFNDYYILCFDRLKQNLPVNITLIDIWTDFEQNGITYMRTQYQVINTQGQTEIYDLEHGTRPTSENLPHRMLALSNMDRITSISGKYAGGKVCQLTIGSTKGPLIVGRNEGINFELTVPADRKVVAFASEFTTYMKCIGAYYV